VSAKILVFDIETSLNLGYCWSKYQQDIIRFEEEYHLLSFAWKWYGESKTYVKALPDYPSYEKNPKCDKALCKDLWELFHEADITVGHNSMRFDHPKANSRFILNGLGVHSPVKMIDTLRIARSNFKFNCNKLDSLAQAFNLGKKQSTGGVDLWFGCREGCPTAWKKMKSYNRGDVIITEKLYDVLRPWSEDNVHVGLYEENPLGRCPCCGSTNLIRRGYKVAATRVYRQYQCKSCGRWSRSVMSEKDKKADLR